MRCFSISVVSQQFQSQKKLKKSVKIFGAYSFSPYICSIRKTKKVITI